MSVNASGTRDLQLFFLMNCVCTSAHLRHPHPCSYRQLLICLQLDIKLKHPTLESADYLTHYFSAIADQTSLHDSDRVKKSNILNTYVLLSLYLLGWTLHLGRLWQVALRTALFNSVILEKGVQDLRQISLKIQVCTVSYLQSENIGYCWRANK